MKKFVLLVVLAALCQGVFAQDDGTAQNSGKSKESEFYYFNVPIEKIYIYRKGYIVVYRKGINQMTRTYLPEEWFSVKGEGKGELVGLGSGREWPSMTVYYKSGEFSHVRLRVRRNKSHETWGMVPLNVNLDEYFEGVEEIQLEF